MLRFRTIFIWKVNLDTIHSKEDFFFIININAIFYKYQHTVLVNLLKIIFMFCFSKKSPQEFFPLYIYIYIYNVLTDFKMHRLIWTQEV